MKTLPNDSVFAVPPASVSYGNGMTAITDARPGLTKREYFAAIALQGIISNSEDGIFLDENGGRITTQQGVIAHIAKIATCYADALTEALNK